MGWVVPEAVERGMSFGLVVMGLQPPLPKGVVEERSVAPMGQVKMALALPGAQGLKGLAMVELVEL
jgi:hypothetical protein